MNHGHFTARVVASNQMLHMRIHRMNIPCSSRTSVFLLTSKSSTEMDFAICHTRIQPLRAQRRACDTKGRTFGRRQHVFVALLLEAKCY